MVVTKPQPLSLTTRPIEYRKRFGLCVTAALHVPFLQGEKGTLWGEQSMWKFLAKEMANPMIDEGVSKLTPEFLVSGRAYPTQESPNACAVKVSLGDIQKNLIVSGERYWDGGQPSQPQPFRSLPISWDFAYGGADYPLNPLGRGRAVDNGIQWLPNIEMPGDRQLKANQPIKPAGFGLLDLMHPQRAQLRGTYDANYLKEHSPGFPPDLDWRFFNLAPQDQWMKQPLRGDEPFSLHNLHPTQALIQGKLPGLRSRVFANYSLANKATKWREVPLRLTTVWFFPHAERCILLFQGLAEVNTDDGSDVLGLLGAVERLGEVKTDTHYMDALQNRNDPTMGAVYSLRDSDFLPEGLDTIDPDFEAAKQVFAMDGFQADAQYRRAELDVEVARENARAAGKDPDALGIKMPTREKPPEGDELVVYLEKQLKEAERQQWQALDDVATQALKALEFAAANKVDIAQLQHRGPPLYTADKHLEALVKDLPPGQLNITDTYPKLVQKETSERRDYLQSAHMQAPALPMLPVAAASLRAEMATASAKGMRMFSGLDFTGADFSNLDLRDMDFSGALLESANLSKSNLSGANFSAAVLAHANLTEVIALGAKFIAANLGRATFESGVFDGSDFTGATLSYCSFAATEFHKCLIASAMIFDTTWGDANWSGVLASGQTFYKLDLRGMVFAEADFTACNFIECDLTGVDLRAALLSKATFITCNLTEAKLQSARGVGSIFVKDCLLVKANLSQGDFSGCNFGGSDMSGASLVKANLNGANLSDAKLVKSDWRLATGKGALIRKADIRTALMAGVNLQDAVLQNADLRSADLRRSNLFGADLSRVRLDGDVKFDDALLNRARTWPRLTPEQQAGKP